MSANRLDVQRAEMMSSLSLSLQIIDFSLSPLFRFHIYSVLKKQAERRKEEKKMGRVRFFAGFLMIFHCLWVSSGETLSIYEVLRSHGLPMGILPKGVKDFSLDDSGRLEVHLDQECNAKFENEMHYDRNISGLLKIGRITNLSGISAQDLFLWFPVKGIRVDIPSSGLIYFDVGVVYKQFSLSLFETPRDCVASPPPAEVATAAVNLLLLHLKDEEGGSKIWEW